MQPFHVPDTTMFVSKMPAGPNVNHPGQNANPIQPYASPNVSQWHVCIEFASVLCCLCTFYLCWTTIEFEHGFVWNMEFMISIKLHLFKPFYERGITC